jgi:uncharacterized membrane protein
LGHTAILLLIGIMVISLGQTIPEYLAYSLDFFVGIMLVYLGFSGFKSEKTFNAVSNKYFHKKSFFIGGIHGLAGSAALVILTTTQAQTTREAFLFMLIFGIGAIFGMLLFTTILGLPFLLSSIQKKLSKNITRVASVVSIVYGVYYIVEVSKGFFIQV